jgi:maleamate amidohydrolase
LWVDKIPTLRSLVRGSELVGIDSWLKSYHEDLIIFKNFASTFFGTGLSSKLLAKEIDTL